jgi:hypothetical protein
VARRRGRDFNVFSLSFLDIMACGLGSVVLLFVIINHAAERRALAKTEQLLASAALLEQDVSASETRLGEARENLRTTEQALANAREQVASVAEELNQTVTELNRYDKETLARERNINTLKADLKAVETDLKRLESSRADRYEKGNATRAFKGEGDRQYLTGLKVGGSNILILLDASASMLEETIVNVLRRRNLPDGEKIRSRKWQRGVAAVEWLVTEIPPASQFQIYTFNVKAAPLIPDTDGQWLKAAGGKLIDKALVNLRRIVPQDGTSLHNALAAVARLKPRPDNLYLITDGLPTQGQYSPRGGTVSAKARMGHFQSAVKQLPGGIPVNVILLPMEGDPFAASAYWVLAQTTNGAFLSPASDWP